MLPSLPGIYGLTIRQPKKLDREWYYIKLMSDLHIGADSTNKKHVIADLEDAKERGARILLGGDVFDGIMSKDFKRYEPEVIDKAIRGRNDIINASIDLAADFLKPYADLIDAIGEGNHETAVRRHHNINLIPFLLERLSTPEHRVQFMGYKAHIQYIFNTPNRSGTTQSFRIAYFHGAGGAAPVTKGAIPINRLISESDNCNVVWMGHIHSQLVAPELKLRQSPRTGEIEGYEVRGVVTGSYLDSIDNSYGIEKGHRAQPHGGAMVKFRWEGSNDKHLNFKVEI